MIQGSGALPLLGFLCTPLRASYEIHVFCDVFIAICISIYMAPVWLLDRRPRSVQRVACTHRSHGARTSRQTPLGLTTLVTAWAACVARIQNVRSRRRKLNDTKAVEVTLHATAFCQLLLLRGVAQPDL